MKKSSIIFLMSLVLTIAAGLAIRTYGATSLVVFLFTAAGYAVGVSRGITMEEEALK